MVTVAKRKLSGKMQSSALGKYIGECGRHMISINDNYTRPFSAFLITLYRFISINSRDLLTEMVRSKINKVTRKRAYQDASTKDTVLKQELAGEKRRCLGLTKVPRKLLDRAVAIRQAEAGTSTGSMSKAKSELGTAKENLARWKEVVNADVEVIWKEELDTWGKEAKAKAVEAAKKRAEEAARKRAAKGKGRAKNGNGNGGGGDGDGGGGGGGDGGGGGGGGGDGGDGDGSRKELRTCTATLRQIMRPDLRDGQMDGETGYQKVLSLLERKQKDITNIEEEISVLAQKVVLAVSNKHTPHHDIE